MGGESSAASGRGRALRLEVDGLALSVVDYGVAVPPPASSAASALKPLLLLHGGMAHARWFDFLAPLLADAYRPFALDRRGHGDSDCYGWERDLADIEEVARRLDPGPWVIAGHSQGGLLAADLAVRRPDLLAGLVLLDVPLHPTSPSLQRTGAALRKVPQLRWGSLDDAVRGFRPFPVPHRVPQAVLDHLARASFKRLDDGGFSSKFHWKVFQRGRDGAPSPLADFAERLGRIAAPTLCLRGAESTILPPEDHAEMVRRIPGARGVEIAGATHNLHVEQPDLVAREMRRLVEG